MKTLIILPAYNESGSIKRVCEDVKQHCPDMDFIVVNDGSIDDTAAICQAEHYPLLNLPVNLGLSGAMGAGLKYAYQHGYDIAAQFDSDGQHHAEHLQALTALIENGADIACGSRFLTEKKPYSLRMLGSRLISLAIRLTTGVVLSDPTSGLRAYGKAAIREYALQLNHPPEPDTISYLIKRGATVKETQVFMDERTTGESYLTLVPSIKYMLKMLVSILLVQAFRGSKPFPQTTKKEANNHDGN